MVIFVKCQGKIIFPDESCRRVCSWCIGSFLNSCSSQPYIPGSYQNLHSPGDFSDACKEHIHVILVIIESQTGTNRSFW